MNDSRNKIVIMIPSLNPDEKMVILVENLLNEGFSHIVVVDDGSSPETQKYFKRVRQMAGVVVLKHEKNKGVGGALKTGFQYIADTYNYPDVSGIVTADADGQHCVEDIVNISSVLYSNVLNKSEKKYLILGTRNFCKSTTPAKSRLGNIMTRKIFSLLYGKKINDTQTGLRGISYNYLPEYIDVDGEGFEYQTAVLIRAVQDGVVILEESIKTIYFDENKETHFRPIKDSAKIYFVLFQLFFRYAKVSLLSFIIDIAAFALLSKYILVYICTRNIIISSIAARVISSTFNFLLNKKYVFGSSVKYSITAIKYATLCIVQVVCSGLMISVIYKSIPFDTTIIKIFVDTLLFFISFQVQKIWVFANRKQPDLTEKSEERKKN